MGDKTSEETTPAEATSVEETLADAMPAGAMAGKGTASRWRSAVLLALGVTEWLVRVIASVEVFRWYGWLVSLAVGAVLLAASECGWRLVTGEWGNVWPTRKIIAGVPCLPRSPVE